MAYLPKSELAWTLEDYLAAGDDPPARILAAPSLCEGQLMTDEEVAQYIKDGIATIIILRDKGSNKVETVHNSFVIDCQFLVSLGRLSEDEYNELIDLESYSF